MPCLFNHRCKCFPLEFGHKEGENITFYLLKCVRESEQLLSLNLCMLQNLLVLIGRLRVDTWNGYFTASHVARPGINTQKCRGPYYHELPFISAFAVAVFSAVCNLSTGSREARWACQYFKRSFSSEQVQVSQAPVHKCNPLQETYEHLQVQSIFNWKTGKGISKKL